MADRQVQGPTSQGIHRLIYYSRQHLTTPSDLDYELGLIIQKSIANNRLANVTGLLMHHQNWFVQVLEGKFQTVQTLYGTISRDARHQGATVVSAGTVSGREFGEWNMCARRVNQTDTQILDVLDQRGAFEPGKLSADSMLRLMRTVAQIQRREEEVRLVG